MIRAFSALAYLCVAIATGHCAVIIGRASVSGAAADLDWAQPDLGDWVGRVQAQGSDVSAAASSAVRTFIRSCKVGAVWANLKRINVYAGTNVNALAAPLVNIWGATTDDLGTFSEGDYGNDGLTSSANSDHINTGVNLGSIGGGFQADIDDLFVSVWVDVPGAVGRWAIGATGPGSVHPFGLRVDTADRSYFTCTDTNILTATNSIVWSDLFTGTRAFHLLNLHTNSQIADQYTGTPSSTLLPNNELYVHARNDNGSAADFHNAPLSFYAVGLYMTASKISSVWYPAVYSLHTNLHAVGRK